MKTSDELLTFVLNNYPKGQSDFDSIVQTMNVGIKIVFPPFHTTQIES